MAVFIKNFKSKDGNPIFKKNKESRLAKHGFSSSSKHHKSSSSGTKRSDKKIDLKKKSKKHHSSHKSVEKSKTYLADTKKSNSDLKISESEKALFKVPDIPNHHTDRNIKDAKKRSHESKNHHSEGKITLSEKKSHESKKHHSDRMIIESGKKSLQYEG